MDNHNLSIVLLKLPLPLQNYLVSSWLTNADVCKLDSAFCSKKFRSKFLKVLESEVMFLYTPVLTDIELISSWMEWVLKRKVRISACHLSSAIPPKLYMRFYNAVGERLTGLIIFANDKIHAKGEYCGMIATVACSCRCLKKIQLQNCESLSSLENLLQACQESLSELHLLFCDCSELQLRDIYLPSLKRLVLEECSEVSKFAMAALLEAAPSLEILNCQDLPFRALACAVSEHLRVLILSNADDLTKNAFCSLVHSCPLLEVVELDNCTLLNDLSVVELVEHAKNLIVVSLSNHANFTDIALGAIAQHCVDRLQHLGLWDCGGVTDAGLKHISDSCRQLVGVSFGFVQPVSTAAIMAVLFVNPLLQEVTLGSYSEEEGGCDALLTVLSTCCPLLVYCNICFATSYTAAGVFAIVESCPQLRTIVVDPACTVVNAFSRLLWRKLNPEIDIEVNHYFSHTWAQYYCHYEKGTVMQEEEDS